jgi:hypothetical protein
MSPSPIDERFGELRAFLHTHTPSVATRAELYALLTRLREGDADAYDATCLPYLESHSGWWAEPLEWCTILPWRGYGQGIRDADAPSLEAYRQVMPFGPYMLEIESLSYHVSSSGDLFDGHEPGDLEEQCVGLKVDHTTTYDASTSQEFNESTARCRELVRSLIGLFDDLPNLRHFVFRMPEYATTYSFQDSGGRPRHVGMPDWQRKELFKELRARYTFTTLAFDHGLTIKQFNGYRGSRFASLVELDLSGNPFEIPDYNDTTLDKLFPKKMPRLERLSIRGAYYPDDASLAAVAAKTSFPRLEVIDARRTHVTEASLEELQASGNFPALREILVEVP